ncbi:MAG: gamma-glutamyltransferase, partial [Sphingomonadaceae bacterium]
LINPLKTMTLVSYGTPTGEPELARWADGDEPEESGTSHFVAVDKWGDAVSYTSTIEGPFGSGLMSGGFYLNNELTDFSLSPEKGGKPVANRVQGAKRPRSSMSPTLVYDPKGNLLYALGAAGGTTIPTQVSKSLIALIDFKMPLEEALALPQLFSPGDVVYLEQGTWLVDMADDLRSIGHEVAVREMPLKANAVIRTKDGSNWHGAGDPRSEGVAISE